MAYQQQTFVPQGSRSWEVQEEALTDVVSGRGQLSSSETIFFSVSSYDKRDEGIFLESFL